MIAGVTVTLFLDTRRPKKSGKCPLKLRIYSSDIQKAKMYSTIFEFTPKDFSSTWETTKPRSEFKETRHKLLALENHALGIISQIKQFSFEEFEKRMKTKRGDETNMLYHFEKIYKGYKTSGRICSYQSGMNALNSLKEYLKSKSGVETTKMHFAEVTPEWLEGYERYMVQTKGKSKSTVGIYLRALRVVFNNAINNGYIESRCYPFGRSKYQIPASRNIKKALSKDQLKILFEGKPKTSEQKKAKDFWFLSYGCNGINIKDIALLKNESMSEDKIVFYRAKTVRSSKTDLQPVVIYLNDYTRGVIQKYRSKSSDPKAYLFNIVEAGDSEEKKHAKIKNFTRFINQNLQSYCKSLKLNLDITTYWARHSYATTAIRNGASMEFVSEALNHKTTKTTQNYFAGFDNDTKKEFAKSIMNFN